MRSNYLKFSFVFLLDLVKSNPGKVITLVLSIICWQFAGTYKDVKCEVKVEQKLEISGEHLYISSEINNDKKIEYKIHQFSDPQELIDDKLTWYEYSGWNIFFYVIFGASFLIWTISTVAGWFGEESGWDINDSVKEAIESIIYCEVEEDVYYYLGLGRLIGKRDHQIRRNYIRHEFGINSLSDVLFCPKYNFLTKSEKRENKLSKIGIK